MPFLTFSEWAKAVESGGKLSSTRAALASVADAGLYACLFTLCKIVAPFGGVGSPQFAQDWPRTLPRLSYLFVATSAFRLRFYFAWKMTEAAGLLFGLPPNLASNMDAREIECATRARVRIRAWNKSVARWLYDYVYRRLPLRSRAARAVAVFVVSAFWHDNGVPPNSKLPNLKYYAYFLQLPLVSIASDTMHASLYEPLANSVGGLAPVVWLLAWFHEVLAFDYFSVAFVCSDFSDVLAKYSAFGWYGHWYMFGAAVAGTVAALARAVLKDYVSKDHGGSSRRHAAEQSKLD